MSKKGNSEPAIKTCSIEAKVITVNNKQINKSFLKQLFREPLINEETGCLKGIPWGYIKLPLEDCKEEDHLHVIWQKDQSLKTSCVSYKPPKEQIDKFDSPALKLFTALFLMDALKKKPNWLGNKDYNHHDYNDGDYVEIDYIESSWSISPGIVNLVVDIWYKEESVNIKSHMELMSFCEDEKDMDDKTYAAELVRESKKRVLLLIDKMLLECGLPKSASHKEVLLNYNSIDNESCRLEANWRRSVDEILEAGQIFIP